MSLGDLTKYLDIISKFFTSLSDSEVFSQCLESYMTFISASDENIKHLFDNGTVKKIIDFIKEDEGVFKVLSKIAEKDKFQKNLVDEGILPHLFKITEKSKSTSLKQHSTKILALLALDDENVKQLIKEEYLKPLLNVLKDTDAQILRFGGIALGNLARSDSNCAAIIESGGAELLINLLSHKETEVKGNACFALTNLIRLSKI